MKIINDILTKMSKSKILTVDNKLTIIHNNCSEQRKIIHQYLDLKLGNTSLRIKSLDPTGGSNSKCTLIKCPHCNKFTNDNHGIYYNNDDHDYYNITCKKCNNEFIHEPSHSYYEEKHIYRNNVIVLGDYMKHYSRPNHGRLCKISDIEFYYALEDSTMYYVPEPKIRLNKREIEMYINKCELTKMIINKMQ